MNAWDMPWDVVDGEGNCEYCGGPLHDGDYAYWIGRGRPLCSQRCITEYHVDLQYSGLETEGVYHD